MAKDKKTKLMPENNNQQDAMRNTPAIIKVELLESPSTLIGRLFKEPVGLSSLMIAVAAVMISIQQGCQTRAHDRLSVTPRFLVDSFVETNKHTGIHLLNNGLGPGEVREFKVLVDGKPKTSWVDVLRTLDIPDGEITQRALVPGDFVGVTNITNPLESEYLLLAIKDTPERVVLLATRFYRVEVIITYCSLYKECWRVSNKSLNHKPVEYPAEARYSFGAGLRAQ
jgi:hypothetical protein